MALGLLCLCGTGCKTTDDGRSNDMASVIVRGYSEDAIRHAILDEFTAEKYVAGFSAPREMMFERKASATSNVLYGGWLGGQASVWERVRLTILPLGDEDHMIGCNAYLVSDHGEGFFEQEKRRSKVNAHAYRKLLQKVQQRLEAGGPPAGP